jgi:hypothetical protein
MDKEDWLWQLREVGAGIDDLATEFPINMLFALSLRGEVDDFRSYKTFPFKGYIHTSSLGMLECACEPNEAIWFAMGRQSSCIFCVGLRDGKVQIRDAFPEHARRQKLGFHVVYYAGQFTENPLKGHGALRTDMQLLDFSARRVFEKAPPELPKSIREVCRYQGWAAIILWLATTGQHPRLHVWGNSILARNLWSVYDLFIEISTDFRVATRLAIDYVCRAVQKPSASSGVLV